MVLIGWVELVMTTSSEFTVAELSYGECSCSKSRDSKSSLPVPRTPQTAQLDIFVIRWTSVGEKPHPQSHAVPASCDQLQR